VTPPRGCIGEPPRLLTASICASIAHLGLVYEADPDEAAAARELAKVHALIGIATADRALDISFPYAYGLDAEEYEEAKAQATINDALRLGASANKIGAGSIPSAAETPATGNTKIRPYPGRQTAPNVAQRPPSMPTFGQVSAHAPCIAAAPVRTRSRGVQMGGGNGVQLGRPYRHRPRPASARTVTRRCPVPAAHDPDNGTEDDQCRADFGLEDSRDADEVPLGEESSRDAG
jgi:hypothetical protein